MFIWSGFFVFSRAGLATNLTAFDITGLRLLTAAIVVTPFAYRWWPYHLPLGPQLLMAACGPGALYSTMMYFGLANASVAYAGVFANGFLPIFTASIALVLTHLFPSARQVWAIAAIILGGAVLAGPAMAASGVNVVEGILWFLGASLILAIYIDGVKRFSLKPKEALAIITLPNAVCFLPLWYFLLPTGIPETDTLTIVLQALFQGLGPGFLAVILFAIAAIDLGPTVTAAFSAAVPATATLLAIPVLGEQPNGMEWAGLAIVTLGLLILVNPFGAKKPAG